MDAMHPVMVKCLAPFAPPPALRSLNDDDIYVVNLRTRTVVQEYGASSASAAAARAEGLPLKPGHALVTGMQARGLGIVS